MPVREGWGQPVEHHHAWVVIGAAVLVAAVALYAAFSYASGDRYKFVARGVILSVNDDKTLDISVTQISGKGEDDLKGVQQTFKTSSATKYYKNVQGKDKRVTNRNLAAGQEVSLKGVAKDDDSYHLTWLRINDRSFTVIGRLKDVDRNTKIYTVEVTTSTYHGASYNGKDVVMSYGGNTAFTSGGDSREADEVVPGDQRVKVVGSISEHGKWNIEKLYDNYTGK